MVEELLRSGTASALLHQPNLQGETPLYVASFHGYLDIVRLLISKKVNSRIVTKARASALLVAVQQGHHEVPCGLARQLARLTY